MGRTFPSFRTMIEQEAASYRPYRDALHSKANKEAFDALWNAARRNRMASGNAVRPIVFQGVFMGWPSIMREGWRRRTRASKKKLRLELQPSATEGTDPGV
jgi:hypothetical protein